VVALREIAEQTVEVPNLEADLVKSLSRAPEPEPVEDEVMDLIATDENIFGVMDVNEEMPGGEEAVDIEAAIGAELFGEE
jgi:DNA-directed RNA polymerase subunit omega